MKKMSKRPDGHEDEEVEETPEDACLDEIATDIRDSFSVGTESVTREGLGAGGPGAGGNTV